MTGQRLLQLEAEVLATAPSEVRLAATTDDSASVAATEVTETSERAGLFDVAAAVVSELMATGVADP